MKEVKVIKACQNGDKEAFNELITFYYPFIFKYLLKLSSDEEITKDMTQDTFLKLITNIDKYKIKGKAKFSTYLITIAKNCYLDYLRKNKKYMNEIDIYGISNDLKIDDSIYEDCEIDFVLKEIDKLPSDQKIAMKLKYLDGLTLKEIAILQKTKPETIKSRIYEGKKKIKKEMKGRDLL